MTETTHIYITDKLHTHSVSRTAYAYCPSCDREHSVATVYDNGEIRLMEPDAQACGATEVAVRNALDRRARRAPHQVRE